MNFIKNKSQVTALSPKFLPIFVNKIFFAFSKMKYIIKHINFIF